MKERGWVMWLAFAAAVTMGGVCGGLNYEWAHQAKFPAYGMVFDLIALPATVALALYVRRVRIKTADEFTVTKKRVAAQTAVWLGFVLFLLSNGFRFFLPGLYHDLIGSLDGAEDGFNTGRVFGMAPFAVALVIGQLTAWLKYR